MAWVLIVVAGLFETGVAVLLTVALRHVEVGPALKLGSIGLVVAGAVGPNLAGANP